MGTATASTTAQSGLVTPGLVDLHQDRVFQGKTNWAPVRYDYFHPTVSGGRLVRTNNQTRVDFRVPVEFAQVEHLDLYLFDHKDARTPVQIIPMNKMREKELEYFTVSIAGKEAKHGLLYAFKPHPDIYKTNWIVDPFGPGATGSVVWHPRIDQNRPNFETPKSIIVDLDGLDPMHTMSRQLKLNERNIYEMHILNTLCSDLFPDRIIPKSLRDKRGTFEFVGSDYYIENHILPYGFNTSQIMPINTIVDEEYLVAMGKKNEWGYNPLNLFTINPEYCTTNDPRENIQEFRRMVSNNAKHGIDVIVDIVGFHNGESSGLVKQNRDKENAATFALRALGKKESFIVDENGQDVDHTSCGHTISIRGRIGKEYLFAGRDYLTHTLCAKGFRADQGGAGLIDPTTGKTNPEAKVYKEWCEPGRNGTLVILEPNTASEILKGKIATVIKGFPNVTEHLFHFRDYSKMFYGGQRLTNYDCEKGHQKTVISGYATALTGNSDTYKELNKGTQFLCVHDGEQPFDFCLTAIKAQFPEMGPEMLLTYATMLNRALHLDLFLTMGPISAFADSENLHTSMDLETFFKERDPAKAAKLANHDPYNQRHLLPLQMVSPNFEQPGLTALFNDLKINFRRFFIRGMELRVEDGFFQTIQGLKPGNVHWYNRNGEDFERTAWNQSEVARRWEDPSYLDGCIGTLYQGRRFGSFGMEDDPSPLYVARTQKFNDTFVFPKCADGHAWQVLVDSTDVQNNATREPDNFIFNGGKEYRQLCVPSSVASRLIKLQ